jgi:hypothetical protein
MNKIKRPDYSSSSFRPVSYLKLGGAWIKSLLPRADTSLPFRCFQPGMSRPHVWLRRVRIKKEVMIAGHIMAELPL